MLRDKRIDKHYNIINMILKQNYTTPETEVLEVSLETHFLNGSLDGTRGDYTVDDEEEWK